MDYIRCRRFLGTLADWETDGKVVGPLEDYIPRMSALLKRLDNPQEKYLSVIVGGTNGKGTVASLLADLLRRAGRRVGLYTSPHLHTLRERIQIDGEITSKDLWAQGLTHLDGRTREFAGEGFGPFTKFEALTGLAAHVFAAEGVDTGIFEVGLGGRYDATNAWDSDLAILTSIGLDHVGMLGDTRVEIAADKFHIARCGRPLFTSASQLPEVLALFRKQCAAQGVPLYVAGPEGVEAPVGEPCCQKPQVPEDLSDRPSTYFENARLAAAAACYLMGESLTDDLLLQAVKGHHWPGRFERVPSRPGVLLDGAHNPEAASALAKNLKRSSDAWTFVVGVNEGHDAAGIIRALHPVAREIVLTRSEHPKAMPVEVLHRHVPPNVSVRCDSEGLRALRTEFSEVSPAEHVCVTGSFYIVALAREALQLVQERDGIPEDVCLESLRCLEIAAGNLGLIFAPVSEDGNIFQLEGATRPAYFLRNKHPFNDYVGARLSEDKAYQYELCVQAGLLMPATLKVFNPFADARFYRYKTHASIGAIVEDAERRFSYPVVVKRNRGSLAQGVFVVEDKGSLTCRVRDLFENSGYFDNVLQIQAFVGGREFRAVASGDELFLAYEKVGDGVYAEGDLNPLHRAEGRAVKVTDPALLGRAAECIRAVAGVIHLGFYGIDLILNEDGFYLLEINANPMCFFYNLHNGRADFVDIYERLIRKYMMDRVLPEPRIGGHSVVA